MKNFISKTTAIIIILALTFCNNSYSQTTQDDIYFTPKAKIKPIKHRKQYTPINKRVPKEGQSIYFYSAPTNSYIDYKSESKEIYLYVFLQGQNHVVSSERPAYNFSFVIDRSGSMQGDKLKYTKEAIKYVINQLSDKDVYSIVKYSNDVETVCYPTNGYDKKRAISKIDEVFASGSTNLSGGMQSGFNLLSSSEKPKDRKNVINRVFLLSDGVANEGITNPKDIAKIARNQYQNNNFTISTLGVGEDYNEELMTKVSVEGGGRYHFIDSPDKIKDIFNRELAGLKSLIASDVFIEIEFPYSQVKFDKVFDYPYTINENKIKIKLSDLFANEQKAILIKFNVRNNSDGSIDFTTHLRYRNIVNESALVEDKIKTSVNQTNNKQDLIDGLNPDADMGYTLMVSGDYLEQAQKAVDNRNFNWANKLALRGMNVIEQHFAIVKPNPYLEDIYDNLKQYKTEIHKLEFMKDIKKFKLTQKRFKFKNHSSKYGSVRFL